MNSIKITIWIFIIGISYSNVIAQCDGRRPDIYDFTPAERMELRDLMMDYFSSDFDSGQSGILQYTPVAIHSGWAGTVQSPAGWHNGEEEFLTWHRNYIQEMENYILSRGFPKYVPLPAWDNSTQIPDEFFNNNGADGGASVLSEAGQLNNQGPFGTGFTDFSDFIGNVNCSSWSDIDDFAGDLESAPHNSTHGSIGGAMGNVIDASGATIFWLFHSYVDESYYCYQEQCENLDSDIYIKDGDTDDGSEPSTPENLWTSPDIWVRNSNDGFSHYYNESLCFKESIDNGIKPVYVYVRVWNAGDMPNPADEGSIDVYWAKGSIGLDWPNPWTTGAPSFCGQPTGGLIGNQVLRSVNQDYLDVFDVNNNGQTDIINGYTIYEFEWIPPNPDDFDPCFAVEWEHRHFCIHARINEPGDPTTISGNFWQDLGNNNNLALKNIQLLSEEDADDDPWIEEHCGDIEWLITGGGDDEDIVAEIIGPKEPVTCLLFGNYSDHTAMENVELSVRINSYRDWQLLKNLEIEMFIDGYNWRNGGKITARSGKWNARSESVKWDLRRRSVMRIPPNVAGFNFSKQEIAQFCLQFSGSVTIPEVNPEIGGIDPIEFDIVQTVNGRIISGERYVIHVPIKNKSSSKALTRSLDPSSFIVNKDLLIYPNPATESFTLVSPKAEIQYDVTITNSLGQVILQMNNITGENTISTEGLGKGIFIVSMKEKISNEISSHKLIIE